MTRQTIFLLLLLSAGSLGAATNATVYAPQANTSITAINPSTGNTTLGFTNTIPGFDPGFIYTSADGSTLYEVSLTPPNYSGAPFHSIYSFNLQTRKQITAYETTYPPYADFLSGVPFAISPDGALLFVGTCSNVQDYSCVAGDVEVFNVASGKQLAVISGAQTKCLDWRSLLTGKRHTSVVLSSSSARDANPPLCP